MSSLPVIIKSNKYGMVVRLEERLPFPELLEAVAAKFRDAANFFKNAKVAVTFQGRTLTKDQEKRLVETIVSNSQIQIVCIVEERPEEEAYYKKALELSQELDTRDGQFYRGNLRAGQSLELQTSVVILGDVHPGASVTSKGNVVVLGSCRGNVYAGAGGDRECFVAALVMKPIQIRIADKIARSAITKKTDNTVYALDPKIAYVKNDHIYVKSLVSATLQDILGDTEEEKQP